MYGRAPDDLASSGRKLLQKLWELEASYSITHCGLLPTDE